MKRLLAAPQKGVSISRRPVTVRPAMSKENAVRVTVARFDDRIVEGAGGKRRQDLIDASASAALFSDMGHMDGGTDVGAWDRG